MTTLDTTTLDSTTPDSTTVVPAGADPTAPEPGDRAASPAFGEVADTVGARVRQVDTGLADPRETLALLRAHGLLDLGVAELLEGRTDAEQVRRMGTVLDGLAFECLTSAFVTWAHRMAMEYLARGRRTEGNDAALAALRSGGSVGVTAMATGMKALAGLEPLGVTGRVVDGPDGSALLVSGRIPWASNLVPGAVIILPVAVDDGRRLVVRITRDDAGVVIKPATGLLALDATASGMTLLEDVVVPDDAVVSEDFAAFAAAFRPTFLILQAALALGVARRAADEAQARLERPGLEGLRPSVEDVRRRVAELERRWLALPVASTSAAQLRELLSVRLDASILVGDAARVESAVAGGAGYVASSPTSRRLRESTFFPVQSPSEAQLRSELATLDAQCPP